MIVLGGLSGGPFLMQNAECRMLNCGVRKADDSNVRALTERPFFNAEC